VNFSDSLVTLYQGNSMEILKTLPSESVDMVMTSPPYYGLRAYKAVPVIWDNRNLCEHQWGEYLEQVHGGNKPGPNSNVGVLKKIDEWHNQSINASCRLCNAWRGQLGSEPTPDLYIKHLCDSFDEVKRVLKKTGTVYVNLDDSFASGGGKAVEQSYKRQSAINSGAYPDNSVTAQFRSTLGKSLLGIPERFVLEMMNRGWIRRNTIIWHKDSVMPESVKDRFTIDFEYLFMFSQQQKYYFERQFEPQKQESKERLMRNHFTNSDPGYLNDNPQRLHLGRNKRTTWTINPQGFKGAHYATYPEELCRTPIEASCPEFICTKCGKPRAKLYKKGALICSGGSTTGVLANADDSELRRHDADDKKYAYEQEFLGYSDCGCGASFEPGVVLDPFSGTSTTGVMAKKLGRRYIGIEISEQYNKMAIERVQNTTARLL